MKMKNTMMTWLVIGTLGGSFSFAPSSAEAAGAGFEPDLEFKIQGDAAKGAEIYRMYCVACHGAAGKGDGPAAVALNPKPKDLSDTAAMAKISDHEIFVVIRDGGVAVGLSPMMTAWKAVLQDDQKVHDVAAFVRSLAATE